MRHNARKFAQIGFCIVLLGLFAAGPGVCGEPVLEQTKFTAAGANETLLRITAPGRYSIQAQSPQGTSLELVDRMAGPLFSAGAAGETDGRIDVLLDEGTYKIRLQSHQAGQGELTVAAFAFEEVQPGKQLEDLPLLENLQFVSGTLGDLQQQSFWIAVKERQIFRLEALGRNLKDCRLWLDGKWLVEATPALAAYEPTPGQPMTSAEFFYDLNPGLYLFTCYGGEALKWAKDSQETPLYVRLGVPELGANGQRMLTISPFGRDAFVIPGDTNFFELSRKDKKETSLQVGAWDEKGSRYAQTRQAAINKESRDPWCKLTAGNAGGKQVVTVQGNPGDRVVLKYFVSRTRYDFPKQTPNEYWISNQASSEAADALDATAVLFPVLPNSARFRVEQAQALELGGKSPLTRKVNLLGEMFVFLNVLEEGKYVVTEDPAAGAKGTYQIAPLLFSKPKDYTPPPYVRPGAEIPLKKGFYMLSIKPEAQGILAFVVKKKALPSPTPSPQGRGTETPLPAPEPAQAETPLPAKEISGEAARILRQRLLWPHVRLETSDNYVLLSNTRPEVVSGFIVRPLPLDLSDPLPVTLLPDEQVPLTVEIQQKSKIIIENDQGASFEVSGYIQPIAADSVLEPGKYTLTLKNTSSQATLFSVKTVADVGPTLTKAEIVKKLQGKANFPTLTEAAPLYRDFKREEQQHFTVLVEQPGLYRLETSGRLATRITVRNRFTTNLLTAEQNGIGRNALVQQYLKPGEYQVTVQTLGKSKGHAGILLRRAAIVEEAGLRVGVRKKIQLVPGEAVRYGFDIEAAGKYLLRSLGLNKTFLYRLEDNDGWPLVPPNQQGNLVYDFVPGAYYYYSLPDGVESRRVTVLDQVSLPQPTLEGKGPHPLALNAPVKHVWREESGRAPDVFVLDVPDPVRATVALTKDLEAGVYQCLPTPAPSLRQAQDIAQEGNVSTPAIAQEEKPTPIPAQEGNVSTPAIAQEEKPTPIPSQEGSCQEIAQIRGGKDREFEKLPAGRYEFRVKSTEENDRLPYTLRVSTDWLISGLRQPIRSLPATFTVSVGQDSFVDLFSFGASDVKATLWEGDRLAAANDDLANDWNFGLSQKLKAGIYTLQIQAVGKYRPAAANAETDAANENTEGDASANTDAEENVEANSDNQENTDANTDNPENVEANSDNQENTDANTDNQVNADTNTEGEAEPATDAEADVETPPEDAVETPAEAEIVVDPETYNQLAVSMVRRAETTFAAQECPFTVETALKKEVVAIPFTTSAAEQLVRIQAAGSGVVKIALLRDDRLLAEGDRELFLPLKAAARYTALLWRLDEMEGTVTFAAQPVTAQEVALSPEKTALPLAADVELAAFRLTQAEKVSYVLQGNVQSLWFSPAADAAFTPVSDAPVVMPDRSGWLLWQTARTAEKQWFLNQCPTVNLLETPETAAMVLTPLFCGAQVELLGQTPNAAEPKGTWYHLRAENQEGWVYAAEGSVVLQTTPLTGVVTTQSSALNIRSKPAAQASALAKAPKGDRLVIKGGQAEWYVVQLLDKTVGYAASQYITPEPLPENIAAAQPTVTLAPFLLTDSGATTLVEVGQTPLPFGFEHSADTPLLLEIKSVGANLGAMIAPQGHANLAAFDWESMWLEPSQTLVAVPGKGTYQAQIWPTSAAPVRGKVLLKTRAFTVKGQSAWGDGLQREGELQPGAAEKITLPDAPQALALLLTDGLLAFVWQADHTAAIVAATNGNLQQRIGVTGGDLILLNTGVKTGLYRIEKRDATTEIVQPLDPTAGFEKVFTEAGQLTLKISASDQPLWVAGDHVQSRFFSADGRIIEAGKQPAFPSWASYPKGAGLLEVSYQPGYVRIWQRAPENAHQGFIASGAAALPAGDAQKLANGGGTLENRDQFWTFTVAQPTYIIAETEAPGVTAFVSQNRVIATSAGSQQKGRQLDYFLQPGDYQLWTRPFKGLAQQGALRLRNVAPAPIEPEETVKTWLIRSGETQVFRFDVTTKAQVGVGVRTESDKLEAALYDRQFAPIAVGPLMFKELDAGEYILAVRTTEPAAALVQYRPVVFGHHGSKQGIPADVMQEYQK